MRRNAVNLEVAAIALGLFITYSALCFVFWTKSTNFASLGNGLLPKVKQWRN